MKNFDVLGQNALKIASRFADSVELTTALRDAQDRCAQEVGGSGGTSFSAKLLDEMRANPFALSRAYLDF